MPVRHVLHLRPEKGVREPVAYGNGDYYYRSKHVPVCETESILSTQGSWESEDDGDDTDASMTADGVDTSEFGDGPDAEDYDDLEDFLHAWKEFAGGREYTSEEKEEIASGSRRIWERNDHKSVMDAIAGR